MGKSKKENEVESVAEQKEEKITTTLPKVENWVSIDNQNYFFSYKSVNSLPTGLYNITINNDEEYPLEADHLSDEMKDHSDSYDFDDSDLDEDWNIGESEQRMAASHQYLETRWENTKKKKLLKKSIIIQQDDER